MPLTALADQDDATAFGYGTIASGYFARASARVRRFAKSRGYSMDSATYTVTGRAPVIQLPNQPVTSITSVTDVEDGNSDLLTTSDWELRQGGVLEVPGYTGNVSVVYVAGLSAYSDGLVELVCAIASRMANTAAGVASGVQQETGGSESVTYGSDSWSGISDLTRGELSALGALFPVKPGLVVMRAGDGVLGRSQTRFDV
jgi:hypothetical protein